jgi:hypothetical protein
MNRYFYYEVNPQDSSTLFDQLYQTGTIHTYDSESEHERPISIGRYSVPFEAASQFQNFIESLETEFPMFLTIGTEQICKNEAAKELMVPVAQLSQKADLYEEDQDHFKGKQAKKQLKKVQDEENY